MNKKEEIRSLVLEIEKAKSDNTLIIVEGIKDKKALEILGLKNIFMLNNQSSLYESIERIAEKNREAIILTDMDKEGKKLYSIIKRNFSRNGTKINDSIRNLLLKLKISHVEGLASFIDNSIPK